MTFDKNGGLTGGVSSIVYVGVWETAGITGTGGVWKSTDGGGAWTKMTGGLTTPARGAVDSSGTLYCTFIGTGTLPAQYGGVFKADRNAGALTDITPPAGNISARSVDHSFIALTVHPAANPGTVYVSDCN